MELDDEYTIIGGITKKALSKHIIYIQVCLKSRQTRQKQKKELYRMVKEEVAKLGTLEFSIVLTEFSNPRLEQSVSSISIGDILEKTDLNALPESRLRTIFYHPASVPENKEELSNEETKVIAGMEWLLPHKEFENAWEYFQTGSSVKTELFNYVRSTIAFTKAQVHQHIISYNRLLYLHGPPGTGKSTLAKALAQTVSIRLSNEYAKYILFEVDSIYLFSKYIGESSEMINKLFESIIRKCEQNDVFLFLIVDEIDSLTLTRDSDVESADLVRSVNSILIHLDSLKSVPNIMTITTSNLTEKIDAAFLDRADLQMYVGHPDENSIFMMLVLAIRELHKNNLITENIPYPSYPGHDDSNIMRLKQIALRCKGMSGRGVKSLPMKPLAPYARYSPLTLSQYITAFEVMLDRKSKIEEPCDHEIDSSS